MHEDFLHSIRSEGMKSIRRMSSGFLLCSFTAAALLIGGSGGTAIAQDAGLLLREQERQQEFQRSERLPKLEEPRDKQAPLAPPQTGESLGEVILVKELRFTGKADLLSPAEQERFAASIRNKQTHIAGLQALADEVTVVLQKQGHLLARAILPPQDVTAGIVILNIADGTLERIDIERGEGTRIREGLLRAIGESRVLTNTPTKEALEDALLRMNDLPGVTARGRLVPGTAPNTSRLVVNVKQGLTLSTSLWSDSYGSSDTGHAQGNALVTLTDLTGLGDQTRFTGSFSKGLRFGQTEISFPWGASGFTAHASYGHLAYRNIDGLGHQAGLEGSAHHVEAGLNYGLIRSRSLNLWFSGRLQWKALVDEAVGGRLQDKRVQTGSLALAGELQDKFWGGGLTNWSLGWTWGDLDLSRVPEALAADAAGLKTQGHYQRLNASLSRIQTLSGDWALFTRIYGQWASKNLDSSEDFALGGPYGVRGWPIGEGRGDMGLLSTVELRYDVPAPPPWKRVQLSAFLDGGRVRINRNSNHVPLPTACGCDAYGLMGAGLGMRWMREDLGLALFYAQGLGNNPGRISVNGADADSRTSHRKFWLQGTIRF